MQGFTSVLNTMLPAFFYWATGRDGYLASLNLFRVVSLAMYLVGGFAILRLILRDRGVDRWSPLVFILLYVTEAKTVAFTMNGQESGFMVGFLALGFVGACGGIGKHWKLAAVSWAGLLYTRPDVPVHIGALVVASLCFAREPIRETVRGVLKAGACAAGLFLPWFVFVWVYYGQPIPHTVLAKAGFSPWQLLANPGGTAKEVLEQYPVVSGWVFEPIYAYVRGWPDGPLEVYSLLCAAICTTYWMVPSRDRLGRAGSLVFTLVTLYLSFVNTGSRASPWYLPSATVFGLIVLSRAPVEIFRRLPFSRHDPLACGRVLQGLIVGASALLLVGTIVQIRIQQREIEDGVRQQIGLYLRDAMRPGEAAYMEPIGYTGYFSDRPILDWPGLVTPEVVALRRQKGVDQSGVIPYLMPDWIVLRPGEAKPAQREVIEKNYDTVKVFDAEPALRRYGYIPGRGYLDSDSKFYVLRKRPKP